MNAEAVVQLWREVFGRVAPVGYLCRTALADRWFRIHSLPFSKRYPGIEPEYQELLARHNAVATEVLGQAEPCVLFQARYEFVPDPVPSPSWPALAGITFVPVEELGADLEDDDVDRVHIAAAEVVWQPGGFDELIRVVARDESGPIIFANLHRGTAYAPYDGGADLFLASHRDVDALKRRWTDWLSPRADGL